MFRKSKQKQNYPFLLRNTAILLLVITAFLIIQNIGCYKGHGLSPPQGISGIRGRITFTGTPPDSTKEVWIAVLKEYPHGITDINQIFMFVISNLVVSDSVSTTENTYDYELEVKAGHYEWVLVVWFPDQEDYLFGAKELGAYYANPDDPFPTPIEIPSNEIVDGIDIVADFENVNNEQPFYKNKQSP